MIPFASVESAQSSVGVVVVRNAASTGVTSAGTVGAVVSTVKVHTLLQADRLPARSRARTRHENVPVPRAPVVAVEVATVAVQFTLPNPGSSSTCAS